MSTEQDIAQLEQALQKLVGETCDKIDYISPNEIPSTGRKFSKPYYTFKGSLEDHPVPLLYLGFGMNKINQHGVAYRFGIFGTWHVLRNAKSRCAYTGALDHDGKLLQNIQMLKNRRVKRVIFIKEKLNLFIEFDNNYWLGIFHAEGVSSGFKIESLSHKGGKESWILLDGTIGYEFVTS